MSHKVLYRKYRPDSFDKIIGQKYIVETLKKSIIDNTFSHAYIFTGPRGTGKTSTAKVLAKTINCTNHNNGEACQKCENCINFNTSTDIIEIDAASNNGVDEIRELRNNITLAPASSKYKIYIIDEVHMLSQGAFNALLKTLEEPPEHAIFILATTEIYKVPITILSRCQRLDFKKIEKNELIKHLKDICSKEKYEYEEEAMNEIYDLSEGCLRDALSILEQITKNKNKITLDLILDNFNIISNKQIEQLLDSTFNGDIDNIINIIDEYSNSGMNAQRLIKRMISYLEKIAINIKIKKEKKYDFNKIKQLIYDLNKCYIDARINENIFTMIKLSFIEQMSENQIEHLSESKKTTVQKKQEENSLNINNENQNLTLIDIRINNCFVEVNKESLKNLSEVWDKIDKNKISSLNIGEFKPVAASEKYAIFATDESSLADLFNIKHLELESLLKKNKIPIKIIAITNKDWQSIKEIYKNTIKNKQKYEYIEEPAPKDDIEKIKGTVEDIFNDKLIEIS